MYPPQTPQTTTNRQPSIDSTTHARYGSRGRADREISASPSPSMAPLQVPRYVDDDGTEYWKQPTKGVRPRWDNDGYGKGRKAVPSSMELILQFFEADSRNWSRFKAGSSGQKGVSVADNIRQFMIRNRAQWARSPDKIKLHVEDFYRNTFQPALSIANDTGVGEGSKVIFKGQTWEIQDLSEDLEKMCPRFKRWRDVIGDKTAVYRDLTGSIDTLASNSDTLGSFGLSLGRAGARDGDAVLIDEEDVYEYLDDPETDVDADSVVSGTPAPPRSLRSLPGSYSSQHEDSASSLASGSSRKSGRSSAMEIKAFGLETEKRFLATDEWRERKLQLMERQLRQAEELAQRQAEKEARDELFKVKQLWTTSYAAVASHLGHEQAVEHARLMSGFDERTQTMYRGPT